MQLTRFNDNPGNLVFCEPQCGRVLSLPRGEDQSQGSQEEDTDTSTHTSRDTDATTDTE